MILDKFFGFIFGFVETVIGTLPTFDLPDYSTQAILFWENIVHDLYKLNGFVPLNAIFQVFLALLLAQSISLLIILYRKVASLMLGGGGAV